MPFTVDGFPGEIYTPQEIGDRRKLTPKEYLGLQLFFIGFDEEHAYFTAINHDGNADLAMRFVHWHVAKADEAYAQIYEVVENPPQTSH